jgi:UDP-glucose:(heptosyl)LPS alpha-1,3-glucosyltransferase
MSSTMKIAMLVKNFITTGGAERYAVELSTRLAKRGHDVHVYAHRWDPALAEGITLHRIPRIWRPRFIDAMRYALETRRLVRRGSYDVIHSHQRTIHHHVITMHHPCYQIGRDGAPALRRLFNRLWRWVSPRHLVYRWLERRQFCARTVRAIISVSRTIKAEILSRYPVESEQIHVIHPGVDVEKMAPDVAARLRLDFRKRHELAERDLAIVFIGSEFKRKGLRCAIEAVGLLHAKGPSAVTPHLFVLGSGNPLNYQRQAEQLGVAPFVHFIGLYRHVEHYYALADLFLLPTLSDPFPLVVLEAMACGVPVIVSRQQGVAEVLRDGDNALLLDDPRDPRQIAAAIDLLCDPTRRTRMGRQAREMAMRLTWERMTDEVERLYQRTVAPRSYEEAT